MGWILSSLSGLALSDLKVFLLDSILFVFDCHPSCFVCWIEDCWEFWCRYKALGSWEGGKHARIIVILAICRFSALFSSVLGFTSQFSLPQFLQEKSSDFFLLLDKTNFVWTNLWAHLFAYSVFWINIWQKIILWILIYFKIYDWWKGSTLSGGHDPLPQSSLFCSSNLSN